ncbi:MAG TPA: TonB family protein [Saprospiraceae bacterium]|nr:TonB family protein [Saprospiraceae bacterium]
MFFLLCLSAQSQDLLVKEKDGLYGFFEKKTMVVDFQFDSVDQQYDGSFAVRKAGKWGLISKEGKEAIPCKYDFLYSTYYPRYIVSYNGMLGVVDTIGTVIFDFLYDEIDHVDQDTQALVKYQGKWCWYKNGAYIYDDDFIFHTPDTGALFPGCQQGIGSYEDLTNCANEKMLQYIFTMIKYPAQARRQGIQGQIFVQFTVTRDGVIKDPIIRRKLGGGCDEEVIRVVNSMPEMIPAIVDGKNVSSIYILPVQFKLR